MLAISKIVPIDELEELIQAAGKLGLVWRIDPYPAEEGSAVLRRELKAKGGS